MDEEVNDIATVAAAWEVEIENRLAGYDRGETASIDADEVFAKARSIACKASVRQQDFGEPMPETHVDP